MHALAPKVQRIRRDTGFPPCALPKSVSGGESRLASYPVGVKARAKQVLPDQRRYSNLQPSELAVTLYDAPVAATGRPCQMCGSPLPARSRRDRKYCSDGCRQRRYYINRRYGDKYPDIYPVRKSLLYSLLYSVARRLEEPVSPAHIALEVRREFRIPFQVEWLPRLCARLGCGVPVNPNSRNDRAFCSNACRQRAYRHARRGGSAG